jgi:hypothetical protein
MKKIVMAMVVLAASAGMLFAGDVTPVRLALVPRVGVPAAQTVHGLDLGILGDKPEEVQGLQLAFIYAGTSKNMVGIQSGFVSSATKGTGLQWGFYNTAEDFTGLQVGFINVADTLHGVQLGLVNVIKKNGALPFMVFVNAGF